MTKLDFKESTAPCYPRGIAYETDNYRVVFYEVSTSGGMMRECKHWRAYARINGLRGKPFGDYVDGDKIYNTRKQAEKACRNHSSLR